MMSVNILKGQKLHRYIQRKAMTHKLRKHRAKAVRCFPLLSAFGSSFGSNGSDLQNRFFKEIDQRIHNSIGDLRALRGYAADEVKRMYGRISFDNAVKIQSSQED